MDLFGHSQRNILDDGVLLIGDAAGLAYPESGEGIRPAIESGLIAAHAILSAEGNYSAKNLTLYRELLNSRLQREHSRLDTLSQLLPHTMRENSADGNCCAAIPSAAMSSSTAGSCASPSSALAFEPRPVQQELAAS